MLIEWVRLKNIKSHVDTGVSFADGVNAVAGKTGAGKSSILEAIGFALFDHLPYSNSDFVREGEKSGLVEVGIRSRLDGNPYTVVRACGNKSEWSVIDPSKEASGARPDTSIVSGKEDVTDWLREHLKVGLDGPSAIPLSVLFQEAIGVPQGLFTAPFLQTPAQRKKVFAPLLGMDDYDKAYENLRETEAHLKNVRTALEKEEAGLVPQIERLPILQAELAALNETVQRNRATVALMDEEIQNLEVEKNVLSERKKRIDELASAIERLGTEIGSLGRELTAKQEELATANEAKVLVVGNAADHQAYIIAKKTLQEVETKKKASDQLQEGLRSEEKGKARLEAEKAAITIQMDPLGSLDVEIAELAPQVKSQEELEKGIQTLQFDAERLINLQERVAIERKRLEDMRTEIVTVEKGVAEFQASEVRLQELEKGRALTQADVARFKAGLDQLKKDGEDLKAKMERFSAGETGPCPFCRQEITPEHKHAALGEYNGELGALRAEYKVVSEKLKVAEAAFAHQETQMNTLRESMAKLPAPAQLDSLKSKLAPQASAVEKLQADVAVLDASVKERAPLHESLRLLGDPRSKLIVCQKRLEEKRNIEARLAVNEKSLAACDSKIRDIQERLSQFGDIDGDLARSREAMTKHEPGYQTYLANEKAAGRVEPCEKAVIDLTNRIGKATKAQMTSKDSLSRELAGQSVETIEARLIRYETGLREATSKRSFLVAETGSAEKRAGEHTAEIAGLQTKDARLTEIRKELARNERISGRLTFVRNGIRKAGPQVVKAMTGIVSLEASIAFSEITKNHGMTLSWNEDYGVSVEQNGKKRAFNQLSGGEQMTAALAVRLALLKEMTGIDAVFFDEPTPHMDAELRENLAEQISRIKGLSQIVVISHDDTFERITEHVVTVKKYDDLSVIDRGEDPFAGPEARERADGASSRPAKQLERKARRPRQGNGKGRRVKPESRPVAPPVMDEDAFGGAPGLEASSEFSGPNWP